MGYGGTILIPRSPHGTNENKKTIILSFMHILGVFENRVLRRKYGPKREKIRGVVKKSYSGQRDRIVNLTSHLHKVPMSRKLESLPP
jgi:hypothetical protein